MGKGAGKGPSSGAHLEAEKWNYCAECGWGPRDLVPPGAASSPPPPQPPNSLTREQVLDPRAGLQGQQGTDARKALSFLPECRVGGPPHTPRPLPDHHGYLPTFRGGLIPE